MSDHWRDILDSGRTIGMHGIDEDKDYYVDNFDEYEFHEFMEEELEMERRGYYWSHQPNSNMPQYHTEHRPDRHFIAERTKKGREWIYGKTWNDLDEFKDYMTRFKASRFMR